MAGRIEYFGTDKKELSRDQATEMEVEKETCSTCS